MNPPTPEDKPRQARWRALRRRLLGGGVLAALIGGLWVFAGDSGRPDISPTPPPTDIILETPRPPESVEAAADLLNQAEGFTPVNPPPPVVEAAVPPAAVHPVTLPPISPPPEPAPPEDEVAEPAEPVAPPVAAEPESQQSEEQPPMSPFAVQIGAYSIKKSALRLREDLQKWGYKARIDAIERAGVELYRLRVVGYTSRAAAEIARREIVKTAKEAGSDLGKAQVRDTR